MHNTYFFNSLYNPNFKYTIQAYTNLSKRNFNKPFEIIHINNYDCFISGIKCVLNHFEENEDIYIICEETGELVLHINNFNFKEIKNNVFNLNS